jgi:hypothetical protein
MKIVAYILALTVVFLSVKPGIDTLVSTSGTSSCYSNTSCHISVEKSDTEFPNDSQDNEICNPFQSCCPCLLEIANLHVPENERSEISTEDLFFYESFLASQFIADFWQPPQFV